MQHISGKESQTQQCHTLTGMKKTRGKEAKGVQVPLRLTESLVAGIDGDVAVSGTNRNAVIETVLLAHFNLSKNIRIRTYEKDWVRWMRELDDDVRAFAVLAFSALDRERKSAQRSKQRRGK